MGYEKKEFTLISESEVFGEDKLEVFDSMGIKASLTDYSIALGVSPYDCYVDYSEDDELKDRTCRWYTRSSDGDNDVRIVDYDGDRTYLHTLRRDGGIRPVFSASQSFINSLHGVENDYGILEVQYGEYPQTVVSSDTAEQLNEELSIGNLKPTGKKYTYDSISIHNNEDEFEPATHTEYEFDGQKYVHVRYRYDSATLSDGNDCEEKDDIWLKVEPITWLVCEKKKLLISKKVLLGGIRYANIREYKDRFSATEMYDYLNNYFANELIPSVFTNEDVVEEEKISPYGLKIKRVTEEEIIAGAIESGVAVFLHGASSEGKSARVLQIDPECEIIYLRNASPESLNGKAVYDQSTGEMKDIPPTWFKKLQKRCDEHPEKTHIVFFDEITNAMPSIQGIAFNIVLNREVNGIWKLPDNARVVAAGNDMKDSLAANQLAEPLFNRFAHVYIKTTTKAWLKWARNHNIHPAIYAFMCYKKGSPLRSKYTGVLPNADPRKWEMASRMLEATHQPEMIRSLVGEEITREFVDFCNKPILTIDDVIEGRYNERTFEQLETPSKYSTVVELANVDEANLETVRRFIGKLGPEYESMFDLLWARENPERKQILSEIKLIDVSPRESSSRNRRK